MRYRIARRFSPQRFGLMWLAIAAAVQVTQRHAQPDAAAFPPGGTP